MKRISKIIFISSVVFLVICISLAILLENTGFEFSDGGDTFDLVLLYGIPLAILLTMFRIGYSESSSFTVTLQTVLTSFVGVASFFILSIYLFFNLCTATYGDALYKSVNNPTIKITERSFGCGAVDSGPASVDHYIVEQYPFGLIYCTKVDTSAIDLAEWRRVD